MATKLQTLQEKFTGELVPVLKETLKIENINAVPKVKCVKINVGLGPYIAAKKDYSDIISNIAAISGQKPIVTKARKSISNFKIREGMPVGITVTLRGKRMYDFVSRLVNITFPRIRDFRGIPLKGFDGHGNYTIGISENTVFPEINPDNIEKIHGLQVTIVTSAVNDKDGLELLKTLGFPFQKQKK
jgi:large subunit ribosomal protein L5